MALNLNRIISHNADVAKAYNSAGDTAYPFRVVMYAMKRNETRAIVHMISPRYASFSPAFDFASALADAGFAALPDAMTVAVEHWTGQDWDMHNVLTNDPTI